MRILRYIAFYAIVFCSLSARAQTVVISDNAFKKCIQDSIPSALNASQHLILSQAAAVTVLECPNYGIVSVNELPYFTSLTELNLTKNPIVNLPDMSGIGTLTNLNIGETSITTLPDFADFPNLKSLSIHRLYLTQFPNLTANTNLVELIAHTNKFDAIPALNFPQMEALNLSLANVTNLPDLSNLPKLRKLECFRNSLTQLPDLSMLDSLKVVDASTNLINQFPSLPVGVQTLYLDNNLLTSIPNLSSLTALSKVRLYKNYLSFEDLLPLTSLPNFSTVYELSPQRLFPVGYSQTVVEPAGLTLNSKIDSTIVGVTRSWYFNNVLTPQTGRFFNIASVKTSDQGNYYATLTHSALPGLVLQTDNFSITVSPCVNLSGVGLDITPTTCLKQGSLKVNLTNQPGSNYKFELEGIQSNKKATNTTGQFVNLEDLTYHLTIDAQNGCKYTLPDPVEIPRENCKQIVLTPNGDNVDDNYYFSQTGTAKIIDKWGNVVHQLSLPLLWDGYISGRKVSVGYYLININNGEEIFKLSVIH